MDEDEMKLLLNAIENDNNESVFKMTSKDMHDQKVEALRELGLSNELTVDILNQLKEYVHIYELPDIKFGSYIKWIPLSDPEKIKLTKGGIVCDIITANYGSVIKCKNFKNKFMMVAVDKVLLFRKLNNQEKILISVSNYLNKE
jgi:hypothetical protein